MLSLEGKRVRAAAEYAGSAVAVLALSLLIRDANTAKLAAISLSLPAVATLFGSKGASRWLMGGTAISVISGHGFFYIPALIFAGVHGAKDFLKKRKNYDHPDDGGGIDH